MRGRCGVVCTARGVRVRVRSACARQRVPVCAAARRARGGVRAGSVATRSAACRRAAANVQRRVVWCACVVGAAGRVNGDKCGKVVAKVQGWEYRTGMAQPLALPTWDTTYGINIV